MHLCVNIDELYDVIVTMVTPNSIEGADEGELCDAIVTMVTPTSIEGADEGELWAVTICIRPHIVRHVPVHTQVNRGGEYRAPCCGLAERLVWVQPAVNILHFVLLTDS